MHGKYYNGFFWVLLSFSILLLLKYPSPLWLFQVIRYQFIIKYRHYQWLRWYKVQKTHWTVFFFFSLHCIHTVFLHNCSVFCRRKSNICLAPKPTKSRTVTPAIKCQYHIQSLQIATKIKTGEFCVHLLSVTWCVL